MFTDHSSWFMSIILLLNREVSLITILLTSISKKEKY